MAVIPSVRHNHHTNHCNFELFINYLIKASENTHCASSSAGVNQCKSSVSHVKPSKSTKRHLTDISAVQNCLFYGAKYGLNEMFVRDVKPEMKCAMAFSSPFSHQCLTDDGEWQEWHDGSNLASLMQNAGELHKCSDRPQL